MPEIHRLHTLFYTPKVNTNRRIGLDKTAANRKKALSLSHPGKSKVPHQFSCLKYPISLLVLSSCLVFMSATIPEGMDAAAYMSWCHVSINLERDCRLALSSCQHQSWKSIPEGGSGLMQQQLRIIIARSRIPEQEACYNWNTQSIHSTNQFSQFNHFNQFNKTSKFYDIITSQTAR